MRLAIFLVAGATIIGLNLKPISSSPGNTAYKVNDEFVKKAGQFAARVLQLNHRRKFMLPKGTIITLTPQITFPVFKQKMTKGGLQSDFQGSFVFYVRCDELGMTSEDHFLPYDVPPFYPFGSHMATQQKKVDQEGEHDQGGQEGHQRPHPPPYAPMHQNFYAPFPNIKGINDHSQEDSKRANTGKAASISNAYFDSSPYQFQRSKEAPRRKRSVMSLPPPENIHGGERAIILPSIESHLGSFGFDSGRDCMLRAICEVHELPLSRMGYGLIGEMITLFFSVSESAYAESHMPEYLRAEKQGKLGDCSSYYQNCTKSIFKWEPKNPTEDILKNFIPS